MDDSTRRAVLAAAQQELDGLLTWLAQAPRLELAAAETITRERLQAVGARVLEAGLAARGPGKAAPRRPCPCGGQATCEGYRAKGVQTLVGWITVRRADSWCPRCGQGQVPLDGRLGLGRDSHSPGVRRLASRFGALLPFSQAAATLDEAAGVRLSASTVRGVTEAVGAGREREIAAMVERAWNVGVAPLPGTPPERRSIAMDGVQILGTDGGGREVKGGVVAPVLAEEAGAPASYAAGLEPADAFGRRLALEAHRRGAEGASEVVVLGDGAAWIWTLAAEHFPTATHIVDWYHASERIWTLGRAHYGEGTAKAATWVNRQLGWLAKGQVARLVQNWRRLNCQGATAVVREEQVTSVTNQASRMHNDQYRARGLDIGRGLVESACKHLIGVREKGPGMRWSVPGAQAVANVRVLLFNDQWASYDLAA